MAKSPQKQPYAKLVVDDIIEPERLNVRGAFLKALCQQLDIDTLNAILHGIHAQPWAYELIEYFYHGTEAQRDLQLNNMRSFAGNATTLERRIKSYVLHNPEAFDPAILAGMWLATVEEEAMRMVRNK